MIQFQCLELLGLNCDATKGKKNTDNEIVPNFQLFRTTWPLPDINSEHK